MKSYREIADIGIVPVVTFDKKEQVIPTAKALHTAGIRSIEITLRTEIGLDAIKQIKQNFPDFLVGAGTVLTSKQVDEAIKSGADFLVSPGIDEQVVKYAQDKDVLFIPGAATPMEIQCALKLNLEMIKVFPSEQLGGIQYLKSLFGPYPELKVFSTGGISENNISDYIGLPNVMCCGGSWMVAREMLYLEDYDKIEEMTRRAISRIMSFRLKHVGLNCDTAEEAKNIAAEYETAFGFKYNENPSSIFCDEFIEVLKSPYLGKKGHIAIGTKCLEKAIIYLERKGFSFNTNSAVYRKDGSLQAIYLDNDIGGFAVHLVKD